MIIEDGERFSGILDLIKLNVIVSPSREIIYLFNLIYDISLWLVFPKL